MSRSRVWIFVLSLAGVAALVWGCATNPVTGRREISLVSSAQEQQIGEQGYPAVIAEYGKYNDAAIQSYVNTVGQKVAKVSHLPDLNWHFTVIDDPTVNAFAMPGGYIYVTRGILAHLNSEAQLAGVLGHEIGHVTHRHTAEQITQQQLYGLGFGLASILSPTFRRYSGAAQQALQLLFLKYSRTDETQADELGVQYATAAGYDSREIPATYAMLKRIGEQGGQTLPGFLSTHPDPGNREATTTELARQATAGKSNLVVNHNGYVQRLDNMVYGEDPREGYFLGDQFFHPSLAFQMNFPTGWKHQNSHSAVIAANADQTAVMQLSSASAGSLSPSAFVGQLSSKGAISGAEGGAENIGGFSAWVGRIAVPSQTAGQPPANLDAAFIRKSADLMLQILGQSKTPGDAEDSRIYSSMRSLRPLTDPARTNVTPDRVRVAKASTGGSFETVISRLGATPGRVEDNAIVNNMDAGQNVPAGTLVKVIVAGRRP